MKLTIKKKLNGCKTTYLNNLLNKKEIFMAVTHILHIQNIPKYLENSEKTHS